MKIEYIKPDDVVDAHALRFAKRLRDSSMSRWVTGVQQVERLKHVKLSDSSTVQGIGQGSVSSLQTTLWGCWSRGLAEGSRWRQGWHSPLVTCAGYRKGSRRYCERLNWCGNGERQAIGKDNVEVNGKERNWSRVQYRAKATRALRKTLSGDTWTCQPRSESLVPLCEGDFTESSPVEGLREIHEQSKALKMRCLRNKDGVALLENMEMGHQIKCEEDTERWAHKVQETA